MTTQFTPGAWTFNLDEAYPNEAFVLWTAGYAAVHGSRVRREANARLIAAAPELLAVLIEAAQTLEGCRYSEQSMAQKCRAAVAKAMGE